MSHSHKHSQRASPRMKPACTRAQADLADIRHMAARVGLSIITAEFQSQSGGKPSLHVMFNDSRGNRLVNWWPATGLTIQGHDTATGRRGHEDSLFAAFGAAVLARNEQETSAGPRDE